MNVKIFVSAVAIAAALVGCGEDKVTNNDPEIVKSAKIASLCHGYYANLIDYLDTNGNTVNDQKFLKTAAEKFDEVYENALDDFLDEGAITDKIIEADMERAKTEFGQSASSAKIMYDGAHNTCGIHMMKILSPADFKKMTDSIPEE